MLYSKQVYHRDFNYIEDKINKLKNKLISVGTNTVTITFDDANVRKTINTINPDVTEIIYVYYDLSYKKTITLVSNTETQVVLEKL